ncbi:hypothetical protein F5144DRAFT_187669 [Chaetomium tenue]|uniref:Uncharacterized protein n=1 Tax=Chaetomium tenue TaxID=1854479 RepID=A0ACB7PF55_9PEZI|nr:hypothetical protein F5144DRAFT_187669 [Chaetomium globosum]
MHNNSGIIIIINISKYTHHTPYPSPSRSTRHPPPRNVPNPRTHLTLPTTTITNNLRPSQCRRTVAPPLLASHPFFLSHTTRNKGKGGCREKGGGERERGCVVNVSGFVALAWCRKSCAGYGLYGGCGACMRTLLLCVVLHCFRSVRPWLASTATLLTVYESGSGFGVGVDDPRLTNPGVVIAASTMALGVVGWWFDRERDLANGCVTLGAPLGGIFLLLVLQILFDKYPWKTN